MCATTRCASSSSASRSGSRKFRSIFLMRSSVVTTAWRLRRIATITMTKKKRTSRPQPVQPKKCNYAQETSLPSKSGSESDCSTSRWWSGWCLWLWCSWCWSLILGRARSCSRRWHNNLNRPVDRTSTVIWTLPVIMDHNTDFNTKVISASLGLSTHEGKI